MRQHSHLHLKIFILETINLDRSSSPSSSCFSSPNSCLISIPLNSSFPQSSPQNESRMMSRIFLLFFTFSPDYCPLPIQKNLVFQSTIPDLLLISFQSISSQKTQTTPIHIFPGASSSPQVLHSEIASHLLVSLERSQCLFFVNCDLDSAPFFPNRKMLMQLFIYSRFSHFKAEPFLSYLLLPLFIVLLIPRGFRVKEVPPPFIYTLSSPINQFDSNHHLTHLSFPSLSRRVEYSEK